MNNKAVIEKLQQYYLTQDPKVVARLCANFLIDINRFFNIDNLSHEEEEHLLYRTERNMSQVHSFLKTGNMDDLELINIPLDEEEKGSAH